MQLHDALRLPCSAFYSTLPLSQGERASSSNETNGGRIKRRQSEVKEGRKGKANADFNRKNGGNGGDADRDGPDWPALC